MYVQRRDSEEPLKWPFMKQKRSPTNNMHGLHIHTAHTQSV